MRTSARRPRISNFVISASGILLVQRHEHVVAVDLHVIGGDRLGRGRVERIPRAQVEAGAVEPALDGALLDLTLGEADLGMGALVAHRVDLTLTPDQGDGSLVVGLDPQDPLLGDLVELGELYPVLLGGLTHARLASPRPWP